MKKNVFAKIDELKAERVAKLESLKAKRDECEEEQRQKENEAAESLETGSAEQYAAAKAAGREAADRAEFYTKKLDDLEKASFCDESTKAKLVNEVKEYTDKLAADYLKTITRALNEVKDAGEKRRKLLINADTYLEDLTGSRAYQTDIMREAARVRLINNELGIVPVIPK